MDGVGMVDTEEVMDEVDGGVRVVVIDIFRNVSGGFLCIIWVFYDHVVDEMGGHDHALYSSWVGGWGGASTNRLASLPHMDSMDRAVVQ